MRYKSFIMLASCAALSASAFDNPLEHGATASVTNFTSLGPGEATQVGVITDGNTLNIQSNGVVVSAGAVIGASSAGNTLNLYGGSLQSMSHDVIVGDQGEFNRLSAQGANVLGGGLTVGRRAGNNEAVFTQTSMANFIGSAVVGDMSTGNVLRVESGAELVSSDGAIGEGLGADGNRVVVEGAGSKWRLGAPSPVTITPPPVPSGDLVVGGAGRMNELLIHTGAQVFASSVMIGRDAGATSNWIEVAGSGAMLSAGDLTVGGMGSQSALDVYGGGAVSSASGVVGANSDENFVWIDGAASTWINSGDLTVGENGTWNEVWVDDGSLQVGGDLVIGSNGVYNIVDVWGGSLDVEDDLVIGLNAGTNGLFLGNGAVADVGAVIMGANQGADETVMAIESSSLMAGEILLGGWNGTGGSDAMLWVVDGSSVQADLISNRNGGMILLDSSSSMSASNYYQDADSSLLLGVSTNAGGAPVTAMLDVAETATFEEGATIALLDDEVGSMSFDAEYTNTVVQANTLVIGGATNANTRDAQALNFDGTLFEAYLFEEDQDLRVVYGRVRIADAAGFAPGSNMESVSDEIDLRALGGDERALRQVDILNGLGAAKAGGQLKQLYEQSAPTYQHGQTLNGGTDAILQRSRDTRRSAQAAPAGAAGPNGRENYGELWVKGYGGRGDRDQTDGFSGYSSTMYGTLIGYDRVYGDLLVGLAGGYAGSKIESDNNDQSDAETGMGTVFASWGSETWFADAHFTYGRSMVENRSGTAFDTTGEFEADNYLLYLGAGRAFNLGESFSIDPEVAVVSSLYDQEAYTEKSSNALPRSIDAYERWSIRSLLGGSFTWRNELDALVLTPKIRAFWAHEFKSENDELNYTIVGGGPSATMFILGPDEDTVVLGAGLGANFNGGLNIGVDVDGFAGETSRGLALTGRLLFAF